MKTFSKDELKNSFRPVKDLIGEDNGSQHFSYLLSNTTCSHHESESAGLIHFPHLI